MMFGCKKWEKIKIKERRGDDSRVKFKSNVWFAEEFYKEVEKEIT